MKGLDIVTVVFAVAVSIGYVVYSAVSVFRRKKKSCVCDSGGKGCGSKSCCG